MNFHISKKIIFPFLALTLCVPVSCPAMEKQQMAQQVIQLAQEVIKSPEGQTIAKTMPLAVFAVTVAAAAENITDIAANISDKVTKGIELLNQPPNTQTCLNPDVAGDLVVGWDSSSDASHSAKMSTQRIDLLAEASENPLQNQQVSLEKGPGATGIKGCFPIDRPKQIEVIGTRIPEPKKLDIIGIPIVQQEPLILINPIQEQQERGDCALPRNKQGPLVGINFKDTEQQNEKNGGSRSIEKRAPLSLDDFLNNGWKFEEKSNTGTKIYGKKISFDELVEEIKKMELPITKDEPDIKIWKFPDGKTVNVRSESKDGRPTMEVYNPVRKRSELKMRCNQPSGIQQPQQKPLAALADNSQPQAPSNTNTNNLAAGILGTGTGTAALSKTNQDSFGVASGKTHGQQKISSDIADTSQGLPCDPYLNFGFNPAVTIDLNSNAFQFGQDTKNQQLPLPPIQEFKVRITQFLPAETEQSKQGSGQEKINNLNVAAKETVQATAAQSAAKTKATGTEAANNLRTDFGNTKVHLGRDDPQGPASSHQRMRTQMQKGITQTSLEQARRELMAGYPNDKFEQDCVEKAIGKVIDGVGDVFEEIGDGILSASKKIGSIAKDTIKTGKKINTRYRRENRDKRRNQQEEERQKKQQAATLAKHQEQAPELKEEAAIQQELQKQIEKITGAAQSTEENKSNELDMAIKIPDLFPRFACAPTLGGSDIFAVGRAAFSMGKLVFNGLSALGEVVVDLGETVVDVIIGETTQEEPVIEMAAETKPKLTQTEEQKHKGEQSGQATEWFNQKNERMTNAGKKENQQAKKIAKNQLVSASRQSTGAHSSTDNNISQKESARAKAEQASRGITHNQKITEPQLSVVNSEEKAFAAAAINAIRQHQPSVESQPCSPLVQSLQLRQNLNTLQKNGVSLNDIAANLSSAENKDFQKLLAVDRGLQRLETGIKAVDTGIYVYQNHEQIIGTGKAILEMAFYPIRLAWDAGSNINESIAYFNNGPSENNIQDRRLSYNDDYAAYVKDGPRAIHVYGDSQSMKALKQFAASIQLEGSRPNQVAKESSQIANNVMALFQLPPEHRDEIQADAERYQRNRVAQVHLYHGMPTTDQFLYETYTSNADAIHQSSAQRIRLARAAKQSFDNENFAEAEDSLRQALVAYNNEQGFWNLWITSRNSLAEPNNRVNQEYGIDLRSEAAGRYEIFKINPENNKFRDCYSWNSLNQHGINADNFKRCVGTPYNQFVHKELLDKLIKSQYLFSDYVSACFQINQNLHLANATPIICKILEAARRSNVANNIPLARAIASFADALRVAEESIAKIHYKNDSQSNGALKNLFNWNVDYDAHFRETFALSVGKNATEEQISSLDTWVWIAKTRLKTAVKASGGNDQNALNARILTAAPIVGLLRNNDQRGDAQAATFISNLVFGANIPANELNAIIARENYLANGVNLAKRRRLAKTIATILGESLTELYVEALQQEQAHANPVRQGDQPVQQAPPKAARAPMAQGGAQLAAKPEAREEAIKNQAQAQGQTGSARPGIMSGKNGCYFNATMQCLTANIPENLDTKNPIIQALVNLKNNIIGEKGGSLSASALRNMVINAMPKEFQKDRQEDVAALLHFFLDQIAESQCDAFNVTLQSVITRPGCPHQSIKKDKAELFLTLQVDEKAQKTDLQTCLNNFFSREDVESRCDICKLNVNNATKQLQAVDLPRVLVFQFKRFTSNIEHKVAFQEKINTPVSFPIQNLVIPTVATENGPGWDIEYELSGIIQHAGYLGGGHYTAYVNHNDQWYNCDDGVTRDALPEEIDRISRHGADEAFVPYILFYKRVSKTGRAQEVSAAIDNMSAEQITKKSSSVDQKHSDTHCFVHDLNRPLQSYIAFTGGDQVNFSSLEEVHNLVNACDLDNTKNIFQAMNYQSGTSTQLSCICQSYPALEHLENYGPDYNRQCGYYAVHNAIIFALNSDKKIDELILLLNDRQDFKNSTLIDCKRRIQEIRGEGRPTKDLSGSEIEDLLPEAILCKVIVEGAAPDTGDTIADNEVNECSDAINSAKICDFQTGKLDSLVWIISTNNHDHWMAVLARRGLQGNVEMLIADSLGQDRSIDLEVCEHLQNIHQTLSAQPAMKVGLPRVESIEIEQPQEMLTELQEVYVYIEQFFQEEIVEQQEFQPIVQLPQKSPGSFHVQIRAQDYVDVEQESAQDQSDGKSWATSRSGGAKDPDSLDELDDDENEHKPQWTPLNHKHFPNKKITWNDAVELTKKPYPAKYKPGINIQEFERMAWKKGTPVTNGKRWKVFKADGIIGASQGIETSYACIEIKANTIHGYPITRAEYKQLKK